MTATQPPWASQENEHSRRSRLSFLPLLRPSACSAGKKASLWGFCVADAFHSLSNRSSHNPLCGRFKVKLHWPAEHAKHAEKENRPLKRIINKSSNSVRSLKQCFQRGDRWGITGSGINVERNECQQDRHKNREC